MISVNATAMGAGTRHCGLSADAARYKLGELGQLVGGMDYAAVGQAVSRFGTRVQTLVELRRALSKIEIQLSNVNVVEMRPSDPCGWRIHIQAAIGSSNKPLEWRCEA